LAGTGTGRNWGRGRGNRDVWTGPSFRHCRRGPGRFRCSSQVTRGGSGWLPLLVLVPLLGAAAGAHAGDDRAGSSVGRGKGLVVRCCKGPSTRSRFARRANAARALAHQSPPFWWDHNRGRPRPQNRTATRLLGSCCCSTQSRGSGAVTSSSCCGRCGCGRAAAGERWRGNGVRPSRQSVVS
jgi:hypothetical protein